MKVAFQHNPAKWQASVMITFLCKGESRREVTDPYKAAAAWWAECPAWRDCEGKKDEMAWMHGQADSRLPRVIVAGLGEAARVTMTCLRNAAGKAARQCRAKKAASVGLDLAALNRLATTLKLDVSVLVREAVIAVLLSLYRYDLWLTGNDDKEADPVNLFLLSGDKKAADKLRAAVQLAQAEAAGLSLARDLANGPANYMTPTAFADAARAVAARHNMGCKIMGPAEMKTEKMGALLAVAQGAKQEPRFVVMEYAPAGSAKRKPLILVGKGITFDSGGISLKPAAGMSEMKGDMSGAAAVLGLFEALGQLSGRRAPSRPIIGLMPCTENMPGGNALHPGDVIVTKNGKTVEVSNTDAEGRLILVDALTYGQEKWQPECMVDIATLTGACVVALGKDAAGLFCDDDAFCAKVLAAGERLGERFWRLPLWEDTSREVLKSNVADLANVGSREGGAIHAAVFLKQFVKSELLWAHMDIAAADNTESPINTKGASGFGVRTLLELALE